MVTFDSLAAREKLWQKFGAGRGVEEAAGRTGTGGCADRFEYQEHDSAADAVFPDQVAVAASQSSASC